MWNRKVFIRIIEVLLCIACVVALRVTDDESRRVSLYLRNRSREWSLLNNVTWGAIGAALATVTCGGYVIITTGLLIAAATGELRGRKTELFLLGMGIILFAIVGALSLASIENVSEYLVDNAAVFGALCLLTALVFIADLLMGSPHKKEKPLTIHLVEDKKAVKPQLTAALSTENESKTRKPSTNGKPMDKKDPGSDSDRDFDKTPETRRSEDPHDRSNDDRRMDEDKLVRSSNRYPENGYHDDRGRNYGHVERDLREYTQNVENERALRDSQRYRDSEMRGPRDSEMRGPRDSEMQRGPRDSEMRGPRDSYDYDRKVHYRRQDVYQRPMDEVDTPRFPTEIEYRAEPVFAKILNPGVKIMRVERDIDERDKYRYSDNSQYDNVPTKLRASTGILRKGREITSKVKIPRAHRDDIEMLEDCFDGLKTTSTSTQTGGRSPPTPTDPGYVRHTASNWPHELKTKTPGSSPDHSRQG